jgi:hypothetical protein
MDIEHDPDVRIEHDGDKVRQVLHLPRPYTHAAAASASHLATLYLYQHAALFGLDHSTLPSVHGMPARSFRTAMAAFLRAMPLLGRLPWRWLANGIRLSPEPRVVTIQKGASVAIIFPQVQRVHIRWPQFVDFPVWDAGIRLTVSLSPLRLTAAYSTLRPDMPSAIPARSFPTIPSTARAAAEALGVQVKTVLGIFIHESPAAAGGGRRSRGLAPVLVYGRSDDPGLGDLNKGRTLPYREYLDLVSRTVVRSEAMASHANGVTGLAFHVDPRSQTGGPEPGPYRPADDLDPFRTPHKLWDLTPPVLGTQQELHGCRVSVAKDNPLGIAPPSRPVGLNFDYTSRSNHFAAVSAYYHCDAAFRMVDALGFPPTQYFAANVAAGKFPVRVVHRAPIRPGRALFDGRTVNAQVPWDPAEPFLVDEMRFAFADLSDLAAPIGIAADARFAWHEFGHALLIAATGEPEFRFAHSAGDALAAIICDLDSRIGELAPAWRGVTFPWVEALRRHDRDVGKGWGWHGSLYSPIRDMRDPAGYRGEQILSTTLFQLYRALGGDAVLLNGAPDLPARRSAAAYTVYLILWAIKAVGSGTPPVLDEGAALDPSVTAPFVLVPALDAYGLAGPLMAADILTAFLVPNRILFPAFKALPRRGGAVHKVVRWVFERQGLYAPGIGPRIWNDPGRAESVDVYIEDRQGREGGYNYTAQWETDSPHVRVAALPNADARHAPPRRNLQSHVFVRVHNRGTDPAPPAARVRVFAARAPGGKPPRWRLAPGLLNRWTELVAGLGATTTAVVSPRPPEAFVDFGPFTWRPVLAGPHALLAFVDAPGDRCNALSPTLACAVGPTPLAHLVPFDNNSGYRGIVVDP